MSFLGRIFAATDISDIQNPRLWVTDALGGSLTDAGVQVSPERAMALSAYWLCIRAISEDIAKLPLKTLKRRTDRGKDEDRTHPVHEMLWDEPSPNHTPFQFWNTLMAWALGWGNAYAEIEFSRRHGRPQRLWPIHPSRVEPKKLRGAHRRGVFYEVHNDDGTKVQMSARRMLHIHGLGSDGMQGYSVWRLAMQSIGMGLATEAYGAKFFANGAHLTGVLKHPGKLSPEAKEGLRESWSRKHQGMPNWHKPAVLEEGMEWEKIGVEPEAAQFLSTRTFNVEEMARWFRMPTSKMGVIVRAGSGGDKLTDEDVQALYVTDTLTPWMTNIEQELRRRLFLPFSEDKDHFVKFQQIALLRGSIKTRGDFHSKMFHIGAVSVNEIREAEDMNPIENGDHHYVPVNVVEDNFASEGQSGGAPAPPDGPKDRRPRQPERDQTETDRRRREGDRRREQGAPNRRRDRAGLASAMLPAMVDLFTRVKGRERNLVQRNVARRRADDKAWAVWTAELRNDHAGFIQRALEPLLLSACAVAGVEEIDEPGVVSHAADTFLDLVQNLRNAEDVVAAWDHATDAREEELAALAIEQIEAAAIKELSNHA